MKHRVYAAHGRAHSERVVQVELGAGGRPHIMPGSFSKRPERAAKNTASPRDKHPHGIPFLAGDRLVPCWRQIRPDPGGGTGAYGEHFQ